MNYLNETGMSEGGAARKRGVALVITLSAVVLLTVLILAFFSKAQFNRQISFSSTNLGKADTLARSALDIILGEIRSEITDSANSTTTTISNVLSHVPKTAVNAVPARLGVASPTGPIVKVSANNVAIRPGGTILGSSIAIDTASINDRSISSRRWYTSTQSSPCLGSQGTMPTWLFVTRANGITTPTITNSKNVASNDYVIGRFAYTIYDVGSLLDANVSGYPNSSPFATPATDIGLKSSAAYADLRAFGTSAADVDRLVAWRNSATGTGSDAAKTFNEWASGLKRDSGTPNKLALNAAQSGHLSIAVGDNAVLSRRDLVRNPDIPATLRGNLHHFERALNAPSVVPATVTTDNPIVPSVRHATNVTVKHYRDDGTTTTYSAKIGDPLVQHRFSLAKLAWLRYDGPNAAAFNSTLTSAQREEAIRDCFGLRWTTDRWEYVGKTGNSTAPDHIFRLSELTTATFEQLEPDFFEYLKAGIVTGSIGRTTDYATMAMPEQQIREANKDLQIFRIGANIIDCSDTDNYPTTITCLGLAIHGLEDLPYLQGAMLCRLGKYEYVDATYDMMRWCDLAMAPILFNPHRQSAVSVAPSSQAPKSIQVRIAKGILKNITTNQNTIEFTTKGPTNLDLTTNPAIVVPQENFERFRKDGAVDPGLKPIVGTDSSTIGTRLKQLDTAQSFYSRSSDVHSFMLYKYPTDWKYIKPGSAQNVLVNVDGLLVVLEYLDASGQYRIYDTLAGNEALTAINTGIGSQLVFGGTQRALTSSSDIVTPANEYSAALLKIDSRTTRFGVGRSPQIYATTRRYMNPHVGTSPSMSGIRENIPFGGIGYFGTPGYFPGLFAEGSKNPLPWTVSNLPLINNVTDPDSIARPGDAWINVTNSSLFRDVGNSDDNRRPVILQRPFRSVGELGYVFRDSPWKTLSFFDDTSGDAALLDLFSVADEPLVTAGRSNLNTTQPLSNQALLTGTTQNNYDQNASEPLSAAGAIATAYNNYAYSSGVPTANLCSNSALIARFMMTSSLPVGGTTGLSEIKYRREAVVRALSSTTQTRTWNLLIDVVAQSGHYPPTAATLGNFIVEGEKRYWLSIAIDRYTGKIIDQQLEPANE